MLNRLCFSLCKTTDLGRQATIKQLELEEKQRQDEVNSLSQVIAQRTLEYQKQEVPRSAPRNFSIEKEYIAIPPLFVLAVMFDSDRLLPASTFCIGAIMGMLYRNQDIEEERRGVKKNKEDYERMWKDVEKEKFEFEISKLNDKRGQATQALEKISKDLQLKRDLEKSLQLSYSLYKND